MAELIAHYGVLIVVLIIFAGELGFPTLVPGEIAILLVGVQVVHSVPALIGVAVLFGLVDIAACNTIHLASRTCGNRLLLRLLRYLQSHHERHEEMIDGWRRRLGGHDPLVVFVTRLIPMFRLYASITTGLIRIRFRDFIAGSAPASLVWATTPLTIGYALRSKAGALEAQFPTMIHGVIIGTAGLFVVAAVAAWVRGAGSRSAALRRLRCALGLAAVAGALVRLGLVAASVDRVFSYHLTIPSAEAVSIWVTIVSLVALALLWIAARDVRAIRNHMRDALPRGYQRSIGVGSAVIWIGLMLIFGGLNTVAMVSPTAIFG